MSSKTLKAFIALNLLIFLFIFNNTSAATTPRLVSSKPLNGNQEVPINSDFAFEFNDDISSYTKDNISFEKKIGTNWFPKQFDVQIAGKVAKLIPVDPLEFNKEYRIRITVDTFVLNNGTYPHSINRNFKTNYLSFSQLMVGDTAMLDSLLTDYSNRRLIVTAPERYITEVKVHHKQKGKVQDDPSETVTQSLTNLDILLKNDNISKVQVDISSGGTFVRTDFAKKITEDGKSIYTLSYGKLPATFDLKILVLDSSSTIIDEIILKVVSGEKQFIEINEKYEYITAGNSYSLYELVKDEKLFNALLLENNIEKIMVQVDR